MKEAKDLQRTSYDTMSKFSNTRNKFLAENPAKEEGKAFILPWTLYRRNFHRPLHFPLDEIGIPSSNDSALLRVG